MSRVEMCTQVCTLNVVLCAISCTLTNLDTRLLGTVHKNAPVAVDKPVQAGTIEGGVVFAVITECSYKSNRHRGPTH